MKKTAEILKPFREHIIILLAFVAISFLYFSPIFEGKQLRQMDYEHALGMSKELVDFEKTHPGEYSLWTNSMFGGMPAYQIKSGPVNNIYLGLQRFFRFGMPYTTVAILFILLAGFYLLLVSLKMNRWICIAGALGFAFASYNIIIIAAGHISKAYAIGYFPLVFAGIFMIFRGKPYAGAIITAIALGIQISCNHPQITYYLFLSVLVYLVFELIYAVRGKLMKEFIRASVFLGIAAVLALLPNITSLWITYEYGKDTIRGPSELVKDQPGTSGLDKDYALAWSYGKSETFTLLVPNFKGGGSEGFGVNSETAKVLRDAGVKDAAQIAASLPSYWGEQPFTSGPVYFGAVICFLFLLGLFIVPAKYKWWLVAASVLSILLSWGKNFEWFTDLFFYYFPMYNKFRTVSMILVIANFAFVLMAAFTLRELIQENLNRKKLLRSLQYSFYITVGLLLVFIVFPGFFFDFQSASDQNLFARLSAAGWPQDIINRLSSAMADDRASMLRKDAFRSLVFIALAAGSAWAFLANAIKAKYFLPGMIILILIDLWAVDKRYLNNDMFVRQNAAKNVFKPSKADEYILSDKDPDFRVLNLTRSVFNDGYTPYFHKSVGGYHGAKLRRYQDVIDSCLSREIAILQNGLSRISSFDQINALLENLPMINMLNTKYIIYHPDSPPLENTKRLGNAWFANNYTLVNGASEELAASCNQNSPHVPAVDQQFSDQLKALESADTLNGPDSILLLHYQPNQLTYKASARSNRLAVFSEIYYSKGWEAYLDGKKTNYLRANYILRAMVIPAGEHEIEFRFEPRSFYMGRRIALAGSVLIVLLVLGVGFYQIRFKKNQ
ncbi:MAG: YfhO family protein [Bacteroidales bacterium]